MFASLFIYGIFLIYSIVLRKFVIKNESKKIKYFIIMLYLILIYPFMEIFNLFFNFLKEKNIYFGLEHANIYLILTLFLCYVTGIIISINILIKKNN